MTPNPDPLAQLEAKLDRAYYDMKRRCKPNSANRHRYADRGITVCALWMGDKAAFKKSVGRPPSMLHQLDRIDNDRGYEPGNVRWVTAKENCRNTSTNRRITIGRSTRPIREWIELFGMEEATVYLRMAKGADPVQALTKPVRQADELTLRARRNGISRTTLYYRIAKLGWDPERAATEPVIRAKGAA